MRTFQVSLLTVAVLGALTLAGCSDDSGGGPDGDPTPQTTRAAPSTGTADPTPTTSAPPTPTGEEVERPGYVAHLPEGWREMDSGVLGKTALTACGPDSCADILQITVDPKQYDLPFDTQVGVSLDSFDYTNSERLADVEHDGQRVFHLVGNDATTAVVEFGMIGDFGTLSIEVTVEGRPREASAIAETVLAGFSLK